MRFRELLATELARRQRQNPRYSLRGFARLLGISHSTLSRLLKSSRPVSSRTVNALGPRLGLSARRLTTIVADEDAAALIHCIKGRAASRAASGRRRQTRQASCSSSSVSTMSKLR